MSDVKSCLVVDDSKLSRMIICKIITTNFSQWKVTEAADAEQALEIAKDQSFDLITLDHNMPGMTGIELYPQIRTLQPDAHIGMISANIQKSLKAQAQEQGLEFINKPINEEKLLQFIQLQA